MISAQRFEPETVAASGAGAVVEGGAAEMKHGFGSLLLGQVQVQEGETRELESGIRQMRCPIEHRRVGRVTEPSRYSQDGYGPVE
jgi:hypothetical protein